ncbi:hypothetical protein L9F63_014776, partial [Diploptera punctata]
NVSCSFKSATEGIRNNRNSTTIFPVRHIIKDLYNFPTMEIPISQLHILSSPKIKNELCMNQTH